MPNPSKLLAGTEKFHIDVIESQLNISGRYSGIKYLGRGHFSLVFRAIDSGNADIANVALKFFDPSHYGDAYRLKCFDRESEILNDLRNQENILPLVQEKQQVSLTHNGAPFPVPYMFYSAQLADSDVQHYIYETESTLHNNIVVFREMCKAIQRIHTKEICHRDLKPGNFLTVKNGQVLQIWLADFGTAKYLRSGDNSLIGNYTATVGDSGYVAPELICGVNFINECSYSSDIYSLGLILFELFTKAQLGPIVFPDVVRLVHVIRYSHSLPNDKRLELLQEMVEGLSKDVPLPSIREYNESIPSFIAVEIDALYRKMASFDFRKRFQSFTPIFEQLNKCEQIILRRKKYEDWQKFKQIRAKNANH